MISENFDEILNQLLYVSGADEVSAIFEEELLASMELIGISFDEFNKSVFVDLSLNKHLVQARPLSMVFHFNRSFRDIFDSIIEVVVRDRGNNVLQVDFNYIKFGYSSQGVKVWSPSLEFVEDLARVDLLKE